MALVQLSPNASEFIPMCATFSPVIKPRKTKDQRACPRKRRRRKPATENEFGSSTDTIELCTNSISLNVMEHSQSLEDESIQWLSLQEQWRQSKLYLNDDEFLNEENERKQWAQWAVLASEIERKRRILILQQIDFEEARERSARQQWAIEAMERERNERVAHDYLNSLTSTNWFNATISNFNDDYELVCCYFRLGCRVKCLRSTLCAHLKTCEFALECSQIQQYATVGSEDYEVVCPNSVLGCLYIGSRNVIETHLRECPYSGKSSQEELLEREEMKQNVILECEEERSRRILYGRPDQMSSESTSNSNNNGNNSNNNNVQQEHTTLHRLLESQMEAVVSELHQEAIEFTSKQKTICDIISLEENKLILSLHELVKGFWPFCSLEVFGSHATGLKTTSSDIDLVACFSDQCQSQGLLRIRGVLPLLQALAMFLGQHAAHIITIKKVLFHTRVPLIKAEAILKIPYTNNNNSECVTDGNNNTTTTTSSSSLLMREIIVNVDISIDSAAHSGLSTTELVRTLSAMFPVLAPTTTILRTYLHTQDLSDPYTGGLSSYGLVLLLLLPLIRNGLAGSPSTISSSISTSNSPQPIRTDSHNNNVNITSTNQTNVTTEDSSTGSKEQCGFSPQIISATNTTTSSVITSLPTVYGTSNSTSTTPSSNTSTSTTTLLSLQDTLEYTSSVSMLVQAQYSSHMSSTTTSSSSLSLSSEDIELMRCRSSSGGCCNTSKYHDYHSSSSNNEKQKEFGRRIAWKLLGLRNTPECKNTPPAEFFALLHERIPSSIGSLIIEFLNFYGEHCVLWKHGFSLREGGFRFDADHPIIIEDPINVMNNVACNCFNAVGVQSCLLEALASFRKVVVRHNKGSKDKNRDNDRNRNRNRLPAHLRSSGGSGSGSGSGSNGDGSLLLEIFGIYDTSTTAAL
eukprot:gene7148-14552_t